jgi:hypothetical protein
VLGPHQRISTLGLLNPHEILDSTGRMLVCNQRAQATASQGNRNQKAGS